MLGQALNEDALKKGALNAKGMDRTIAAAAKAAAKAVTKVLARHQCVPHTTQHQSHRLHFVSTHRVSQPAWQRNPLPYASWLCSQVGESGCSAAAACVDSW
jgi:hypothetical protein